MAEPNESRGINAAALGALINGDLENAVVAQTPGGIEAQESRGQATFVASRDRLPARGSVFGSHGQDDPVRKKQWEAVGFVFPEPLRIEINRGRAVFAFCTFPDGWSLRATPHAMWSDVIDPKGRKRAMAFFKSAFYDYSAHTSGLMPRYTLHADYINNTNYDDRRMVHYVTDNATGDRLHSVTDAEQPHKFGPGVHQNRDAVAAWLAERFPGHADPLAYWD